MRQVAGFFGRAIAVTNAWDEDALDEDGVTAVPFEDQGWYWAEDSWCQEYQPPTYDDSVDAWESARGDADGYDDLYCRDDGAPGTQVLVGGTDDVGALRVALAYPDIWFAQAAIDSYCYVDAATCYYDAYSDGGLGQFEDMGTDGDDYYSE